MARLILALLTFICFCASEMAFAQMAVLGEPLKKQYKFPAEEGSVFYQSGEVVDSYSMTCDMGQALPNPTRGDNWYSNKPIPGLKFELRARAAIKNLAGVIEPAGFIVITKNGEVLKVFRPLGDFTPGYWDGDTFNTWSGTDTDIGVYSERFGADGYAHFDLLSGQGLYYKKRSAANPEYFLYGCRRIKKTGLPVYTWKFGKLTQPSPAS